MGTISRRSYGQGWCPDCDAATAPVDALLRADNLWLDELGVVGVRPGSAKINGVALTDLDVHSLYTAVLSGTRHRLAAAGAALYDNSAAVGGVTFAGAGDVAFGSHLGQVLMARSTTTVKYDGTARNWGIAMTGGVPTLTALATDSKVFATCTLAAAEFTWPDDDGTGAGYAAAHDGTANGALVLRPNATTGRGTVQKDFGGTTDFTSYSGGQTAVDDDIIEFYMYLTEPVVLQQLRLMIDVNSASGAFQDDYYYFDFDPDNPQALNTASADLHRSYTARGRDRERVRSIVDGEVATSDDEAAGVNDPVSVPRTQKAGWTKFRVRRGQMRRVGSTNGKDWSTVRYLALTVRESGGGTGAAVRFDTIQIIGGSQRTLLGNYKWAYVLVRNASGYQAKSAPSAFSVEAVFEANGATVTVPADGGRDSQANELWLYRMGGVLDDFYRVAVKTFAGAGAVAIDDTLSDRDALITNLRMESDNAVPPANIISIAGPYFARTCVLTSDGQLWPSRRLNPDSFATGQTITVTGTDETAYWVKKAIGGLYVGTSKDVYVLDGDGAELPDGSINFTLRPLNIDHPPINDGVTQDGNLLIYFADDGWRAISGAGSQSLVGLTSLLYRGQTRHGVSPVNVTGGRFRAAVGKGQLVCVTPLGASTTSSGTIFRYVFTRQQWYGHIYTPAFRCVYREPDGTLIASDTAGFVWTLDTGTQDAGANIAVTMWTKVDDNDESFTRKDPQDGRYLLDTGGATASIAVHLDASGAPATTVNAVSSGMGVVVADLSGIVAFKAVQYRVTGSFSTFRWASSSLGYLTLPYPLRGGVPETNAGYAGEKVLTGLKIRVCTLGVNRTFTPYLDGVAGSTFVIASPTDQPDTYIYQFTATQTATDVSFTVDGDIELYDWEPIVLYRLPVRVKVWENKPLVPSAVRRRFGGLTLQIDTKGANATVTPVLDGADQTTIAVTDSDLLGKTLTFTSVVGRDLWCRVTSSTAFLVHSVEPIVLETFPQAMKGLWPTSNAGFAGEKVLTGLQVRVCTLNAARAFTPILDGAVQSSVSFTTGADEPVTEILQFTTPKTATDIALSVDGNVELYAWEPIVLYQLPARVKIWEQKPLVPSVTRRRFGGFTLQVDTHGGTVTVTPVLDGVDQTTLTVSDNDLLGKTLTFTSVVGRDLWCRLTSATPFTVHSVAPIILETLPTAFKGLIPKTNAGHAGEKVLTGIKIRVCTLNASRTFTPILDGVPQTTVSFTTGADEPVTEILQFTTPKAATDVAWSVDGDVELYDWEPLVLYPLPVRLKIWENKPLQRSPVRRLFNGLILQMDTHGAAVTVTPVLDGADQPALTVTTSDLVATVLTFTAVVGRDLWCRISGSTPFTVLAVEPVVAATLPQFFKGQTPRALFGYDGLKTISGLQLRVCTLGATRTFTPVLDGVPQTTSFTVTSNARDPIEVTQPFAVALQAVDLALSVDGDVELYDWKPLITAKRPLGVKAWDSGPIDLGSQELVWLRQLWLKVRAGASLTVTPYFDDQPFPAVTVTPTAGVDTIVPIPVGRSYIGRQPRLVVTSTAAFNPYWIKVRRRVTGQVSDKPDLTIPVTLERGVSA